MGPPASYRVSVPRSTQDTDQNFTCFVYGTLTPYGRLSQYRSTTRWFLLSVLQPQPRSPQVGLGCSAFARHYLRNCFFSSGYLDVSVPRVPRSLTMCSPVADLTFLRPGFPIRISVDQHSSAIPHSFSQRYTSFIGTWRQGIHRVPLVA